MGNIVSQVAREVDHKLKQAAQVGDEALVSQCIEQGARVNLKDGSDRSALQLAAENGHPKVVSLLLDAGWDVDHDANGGGFTPLYLAARSNQLETAKCLLLRGANIDARDNGGNMTPLHIAAQSDHKEVVRFLLMCGANQEIRSTWGETAYDRTSYDEPREVLREFSEKNMSKNELLQQATNDGNTDVVKILILQGATVEGEK